MLGLFAREIEQCAYSPISAAELGPRMIEDEGEQELLDEVAEIDEKWAAKADAIETVPIRLEAGDVRVVETTLVWVPTA